MLHTHTRISSTHRHTHTLSHTEAFTHRRLHRDLYTQTLSHTDAFTQHFYTQTLLHTDTLTQTLLHTDAFTHRGFYTQKLLYTQRLLHRHFYTQTLLLTDAFTHRHFYTHLLRKFLSNYCCGVHQACTNSPLKSDRKIVWLSEKTIVEEFFLCPCKKQLFHLTKSAVNQIAKAVHRIETCWHRGSEEGPDAIENWKRLAGSWLSRSPLTTRLK